MLFLIINLISPNPEPQWAQTIHAVIGGLVILFASLNAAVVIFKMRPLVLGLLAIDRGHGTSPETAVASTDAVVSGPAESPLARETRK